MDWMLTLLRIEYRVMVRKMWKALSERVASLEAFSVITAGSNGVIFLASRWDVKHPTKHSQPSIAKNYPD